MSGTILDNAGAPVRDANATLLRTDRERDRFSGRVDAAGRFVINDVPAGKYLLQAAKTTLDGPPRKGEAISGYLPVTVEGADVEGLVVSIGPGAVVGGHVTFLDGAAPRNQKIAMKVQASPGSSMALASWLSVSDARVSESGTFELADLFLPSTIVAYDIPDGWAVASIRYRGRDVRNVPVRFETDRDPRALEIQLTSKVGELSGKVLGESDTPVTMACIVAVGANAPRPLAVTAFTYAYADSGVFRLPSLPAGAYTVAAVAPSGCVELRESPAVFDELGAQAVTLGVGERRTMDLRLSSLPAKR